MQLFHFNIQKIVLYIDVLLIPTFNRITFLTELLVDKLNYYKFKDPINSIAISEICIINEDLSKKMLFSYVKHHSFICISLVITVPSVRVRVHP